LAKGAAKAEPSGGFAKCGNATGVRVIRIGTKSGAAGKPLSMRLYMYIGAGFYMYCSFRFAK
jgi:hypothetical protein